MIARVAAVVVTFEPDLPRLAKAIQVISKQVDSVLVVDNGSKIDLTNKTSLPELGNVRVKALARNCGIASAQNIGISWARECGVKYVLLMDQDSIAASDMVEKLLTCYSLIESSGKQIAAIGPRFHDDTTASLSHFVKIGLFGFKQVKCEPTKLCAEVDFLISSGALLQMEALNQVGDMDESLFIDHVDTEWCLRAQSLGWTLFGALNTTMSHTLGEHRREIWFLRKRVIPFHKPFRYYYIYRNSCLLYKRHYLPLGWKLADAARCVKMFVVFLFMSDHSRETLAMMLRGIKHGLSGRTGKMP